MSNSPSLSSAVNHKRNLSSSQVRPSPEEPTLASSGRANKRARFDGSGSGNGDRKLSNGAKWMAEMLERMVVQYQAAVMAAAIIVQYQAYSKRIGLHSKHVPSHLASKLNIACAAYGSTRRHIEWYTAQNATFASSTSEPLPTPNTDTRPPQIAAPVPEPAGSPIPLSTSPFLSYDPPNPIPSSDTQLILEPQFGFRSDQPMDLSSLGISELTAIINCEDYSFPVAESSMPPDTQAATDKLLASLGEMPGQGRGPTPRAGENVDALLASFERDNADQSQADFNFGFQKTEGDGQGGRGEGEGAEVDLSELVGLFSGPATEQAAPPASQQNFDSLLAGGEQQGGYPHGETYDLGGIDLEDFNFGEESDGSIPNVEGDAFDQMFAEFK